MSRLLDLDAGGANHFAELGVFGTDDGGKHISAKRLLASSVVTSPNGRLWELTKPLC
jgi:hypothetical protein